MKSEANTTPLPEIDDYVAIFGRQWDCRNVIPVHRYIDGIKTEENKFTTQRYYLECHDTQESMVLDERNLLTVLSVAGVNGGSAPAQSG